MTLAYHGTKLTTIEPLIENPTVFQTHLENLSEGLTFGNPLRLLSPYDVSYLAYRNIHFCQKNRHDFAEAMATKFSHAIDVMLDTKLAKAKAVLKARGLEAKVHNRSEEEIDALLQSRPEGLSETEMRKDFWCICKPFRCLTCLLFVWVFFFFTSVS